MRNKYVYSDIEERLTKQNSGDYQVVYDGDAVLQSVKNILSTIPNERVRNPIGSSLLSYLFQPMTPDTVDEIKTEITRSIRVYEPRVQRLQVNVKPDISRLLYIVSISFTINRFTTPYQFQVNLRQMN